MQRVHLRRALGALAAAASLVAASLPAGSAHATQANMSFGCNMLSGGGVVYLGGSTLYQGEVVTLSWLEDVPVLLQVNGDDTGGYQPAGTQIRYVIPATGNYTIGYASQPPDEESESPRVTATLGCEASATGYQVSEFADPVSSEAGVTNVAKAGRTIPFTFRFTAADGTPVTSGVAATRLQSRPVECDGGPYEQVDDYGGNGPEQLVNLGDGWYSLMVRTPKEWAGRCFTLGVQASLGNLAYRQSAEFRFR